MNETKETIHINIDGVVRATNKKMPKNYLEYEDGTIVEIENPTNRTGDTWYYEEGECYHYHYSYSDNS